jgi:triacylglycerol lipase
VASTLGDQVASVVTIASPMAGDPIADMTTGAGSVANDAVNVLLNVYGALMGYDSNAQSQIAQLTTAGATAFFKAHPDREGVAYFSIAGRSAKSDGVPDCGAALNPPFVAKWNGMVDPVDPLFAIPAGLLDGLSPKPVHDGLVTVTSARHGVFLGCIPADHMDEVNQLAGDSPGPGNSFDAVQFYRDLAAWLVGRGF